MIEDDVEVVRVTSEHYHVSTPCTGKLPVLQKKNLMSKHVQATLVELVEVVLVVVVETDVVDVLVLVVPQQHRSQTGEEE